MPTRDADWMLVEELFERGEPAFVDAIRKVRDGDRLGAFAERWLADRRPEARRLLLDYLDRPLNAFRHEALVKRLFKLAEAAGDDEVMGAFLVAFDRAIRRVRRKRRRYESQQVDSEAAARDLAAAWRLRGFEAVNSWGPWNGRYTVSGLSSEERVITPRNTAMPRGATVEVPTVEYPPYRIVRIAVPDWLVRLRLPMPSKGSPPPRIEGHLDKLGRFRLYSIPTREYLRRRAWRYFRRLGKADPGRYVEAIAGALARYDDADVKDGLALLDNWGLLHALFGRSRVVAAAGRHWRVVEGRSLAELEPAPRFKAAWRDAPRIVLDLAARARCRPVRQWAVLMLRGEPDALRGLAAPEEWLALLGHADSEVANLAAEGLQSAEGLDAIPVGRWLALAESAAPAALEAIAALIERHVAPDRVAFAEAVRLATARPLPLARLGLAWLRARPPAGEGEAEALLTLAEAPCEPLRPALLDHLRERLAAWPTYRPDWIVDLLDGRHADARAAGWAWLQAEPAARDDVTLWRRLLESPYDDVRFRLLAALEARLADGPLAGDGDADGLRLLWASVLLNVHRGGRAKPGAVRQVVRRLESRPDEAPALLPLLGVALRSLRGPEWRAGLVAIVGLATRRPEAAPLVFEAFPELHLAE